MGMFSKIKEVDASKGGVYFEPGNYELEVIKIFTSRNKAEDRPYFLAEFKILTSDNPSRKAGTSVAWMVMLDRYQDTALGNIKGFCAALTDLPEDEVDEAGVEELISAENPGAGMKVRAQASAIATKKALVDATTGKKIPNFTKVLFSAY